MSEKTYPNFYSYKLENARALILNSQFIIDVPKNFKADKVIEGIVNNNIDINSLVQSKKSNTKLSAIKISSIAGLYTDVKHDDLVLLEVKDDETGKLDRKKVCFKAENEKDNFINDIYNLIQNDFTSEKQKNTAFASMRIPLKYLLNTILTFVCFFVIMFIVETSESVRIPVVLYPFILLAENVGYTPILSVAGVICLIFIIWAVKNMIVPTDKLVIRRKKL